MRVRVRARVRVRVRARVRARVRVRARPLVEGRTRQLHRCVQRVPVLGPEHPRLG